MNSVGNGGRQASIDLNLTSTWPTWRRMIFPRFQRAGNPLCLIKGHVLTTRRWNLAAAKSQFIIKRIDGEPLTRRIIQFDLLEAIFNDKTACFMDGTAPTAPKISFGELYRKTLMNSNKMTGSQRAKMEHTPDFGIVMAQVCMLVNVGRINTTLACEYFTAPFLTLSLFHPKSHRIHNMMQFIRICVRHFERIIRSRLFKETRAHGNTCMMPPE